VASTSAVASDTGDWDYPATTTFVPTPASSDFTGVAAVDTASSAAAPPPTMMLSSATYVYTMGTGSSQTVVTITTVITRTFTETSVCSFSFLRRNPTQLF
jgi:hypothetical protein